MASGEQFMKKPIVWTIAGVDSSGLAGIHADMETFSHLNVRACSVITAVTAQNAHSIVAVEAISGDQVEAQCNALKLNFKPDAIKIGMLGSTSTCEKVVSFLKDYEGFAVLDPIITSSSGTDLFFSDLQEHKKNLIKLLPYVTIITPNKIEAETILNRSISSYQDVINAATDLLSMGAKQVLLKGGHLKDNLFSQDYWTDGKESFWIANPRFPETNYRGTGCVLSAALTACLALGYSMKDAIVISKMYVNRGIRQSIQIDKEASQLFHDGWPEDEADLPYLSPRPLIKPVPSFKKYSMGFYPIVDSSYWLEILLPLGIKCIQLRIKEALQDQLEEEIKRSVLLANQHNAALFINDYWELAIHYGAAGVHLGQEDLENADVDRINQSGLFLGVSTHCYYEVARAHALNPSYVACGPIYETTSKIMPFQAQGVARLERWRKTLHYPLVAIGGITLKNLSDVLKTKVDGVSVISAITKASAPLVAAKQFLTQINEFHNE
ncbi:TPA: bifunctional hydroxymethylpyrimidine kinase/phosphomethylpyrimidine kinase [Legionella pneumophila]|uniref:Thiamine-phosphate synthase n=2 Tax=Legionella pneumophila TaxID=446 RepID=A0A2S6EZS6_LEGPN|nr:bifunctional hydroxymethylpyrimidine kinase/phosphomethylpyrimidine kinase [Legionella pneumophila]TIH03575.1 bifunctional hydroxymethylpyrimidine kinase/phosphomethylpyrimidine kinase [Legionella pneumophila]HAT6808515.1 bifunctional hydroxymethylpyrimidine kinase/phosphomethylpyrimidine kinase [Legionella pneumophila]HAT6811486.1 bifunctional hydroxymethylpyrimidine kinase/phosphomethylpyrimidine kinase [Legionella pneumophila]HAT6901292.1 bifunctional hydroxymethylpyrimidine kinase/phosph